MLDEFVGDTTQKEVCEKGTLKLRRTGISYHASTSFDVHPSYPVSFWQVGPRSEDFLLEGFMNLRKGKTKTYDVDVTSYGEVKGIPTTEREESDILDVLAASIDEHTGLRCVSRPFSKSRRRKKRSTRRRRRISRRRSKRQSLHRRGMSRKSKKSHYR